MVYAAAAKDAGMGIRNQQKKATREAIAEAAHELFAKQGLLRTTTAQIARAAGLSHGTLFVHFPRREDLQSEVIARVGTRIAGAVHSAAASRGDIKDVLRSHLRAIAEEEDFYIRLLIEAPLLGPSARSTLIGIQSAVAHHFFGSESGQPADVGEPALLFNTWIGLVHHYLMNRDLFAPGVSVVEKWGEVLVRHFADLIDPARRRG